MFMKNLPILLLILALLFVTGCASTCMEYRSATTAARSEKNLIRAEEWGMKALVSPECNPDRDAMTPYFLATEVYLNQKNYRKMAEMLTIAEKRNPDQLLENPFKLGDTPIQTIREGVEAYREQEWVTVYNKAVDLIKKERAGKAHEQIEIAILINHMKAENYSTLSALHMKNKNIDEAIITIDRGLEVDDKNSMLYQMKADFLLNDGLLDSSTSEILDSNNMGIAKELYLKAIKYSDDPGPIMRKLLFVYIDLGENQQAIDYSNQLLNKYPDDPDLYYNVGVLYQRLTMEMFDPVRDLFLQITPESDPSTISEIYNSFKTSRQYAYNAKDYFLQASDLELDENISTGEAVYEMRKLMNQIDEIFIPSIRETARLAGVDLE